MKRALFVLLLVAQTVCTHAQGLVNFVNLFPNLATPVVNAPVYLSDGVTPLSGSQFMAELLGGPSASNLASVATTGFLTGAPGYFNGGTATINTVSPGLTAWVEVRVWNTASGSSFAQAQASGLPNSWWASSVFSVTVGGGVVNPIAAAPLDGLGTSPVCLNSVPEPATPALLGLGCAVLFIRNRRLN